tara:strand:+ start:39303 stop:39521 length:219 start_codon:yes stop_codon:yes gene_type:complete
MLIADVRRPGIEKCPLDLIDIHLFGQFAADLANDLIVRQTLAPKIDATEELVIDIAVELLHQTPIGTTGIML